MLLGAAYNTGCIIVVRHPKKYKAKDKPWVNGTCTNLRTCYNRDKHRALSLESKSVESMADMVKYAAYYCKALDTPKQFSEIAKNSLTNQKPPPTVVLLRIAWRRRSNVAPIVFLRYACTGI
jgi:hypothetical protein